MKKYPAVQKDKAIDNKRKDNLINKKIFIWISKNDLAELDEKVKKTNLSRSEFARRLFKESVVKEAPSADIHNLIFEMRKAGNSLGEILNVSEGFGSAEIDSLKNTLSDLQDAIRVIVKTYSRDGK